MSVKFDVLTEYFVEMERDALDEVITDLIVRTTVNSTSTGQGSFAVSTVIGYHARGQLVTCQIRRGNRAFPGSAPMPDAGDVQAAIERDNKALADFCTQHGLDLRGGRFE